MPARPLLALNCKAPPPLPLLPQGHFSGGFIADKGTVGDFSVIDTDPMGFGQPWEWVCVDVAALPATTCRYQPLPALLSLYPRVFDSCVVLEMCSSTHPSLPPPPPPAQALPCAAVKPSFLEPCPILRIQHSPPCAFTTTQ